MKKVSVLISMALFIALFITGCDNMSVSTGDGSNKIVGNGKLSTENREVSSFNQIYIEGVFNVILTQSNKESVKVETDENIQPFILINVEGNVLSVKMKDSTSINKMKKINIYISVVDIAKINSTGVGSLKCPAILKLKDFEFVGKGLGATELKLSLNNLTIRSEIVGAIILSGDANEVVIKHSGVGAIDAFDLKAERLSLQSDGIGSAEVYASKELNIHSSGLGRVRYKGNPQVKNIKNEGFCKIEEAN
jgi:hypothetical protein